MRSAFLISALIIFFLCFTGTVNGQDPRATNDLRVGKRAFSQGPLYIQLNQPVEFDFMTKDQILSLRKAHTDQYHYLVEKGYSPSFSVFGQIQDNKPWWGIWGQFCGGNGKQSIEGPSEESRFIMNPFLLLGIDESMSFSMGDDCLPVYPVPKSLYWDAVGAKAALTYDMSEFFEKKEKSGFKDCRWGYKTFMLVNMNARDFGYNYVLAVAELSKNVSPAKDSRMFKEASKMNEFIHVGGSCGYPGGCNNSSPDEKNLYFTVERLPARLYCRLWKNQTQDTGSKADFEFVLDFE